MTDRHACGRGWGLWLVALLLLGGSGCETLNTLGSDSKPTARIAGARLTGVSTEAAKLTFDIDVSNPYQVPLPLTNLDFSLATQGSPFVTGSAASQGTVPAKGKKRIELPVSTRFADLLSAVQGVRPGQVVPYTANFTFSAEAPAVGTISLPVTHQGELPIPAAPTVELVSIKWQELSLDTARAVMSLRVINRNAFPIDLNRLGYALTLSDTEVLQSGLGKQAKFEPNGGEQVLEIPLSFSPKRLGFAGLQMLGGRGAGYKIAGTMNADTPYGPIEMPYEKSGETVFRR
jgi:LEA14-like dessication related protein